MVRAQKPDFVFRRNGRVHLNRRWASVHLTTGSRSERISGSNAGYNMFRGSVKGTGYPLHSPVPPSSSGAQVERGRDGHLQVWWYQMLYNTILISWWWAHIARNM